MQLNPETLLQTIRQNKLFPAETRLVVAVSGGADSLALLHCLTQLRSHYPLYLTVASLNHRLRPEASEELAFVHHIADAWGLAFLGGQIDVMTLSQSLNIGIEAAARKARYDFLAEVAQQTNTYYVATAHQAGDQSETILLHLIRGSGTQGLTGMKMQIPMPEHPEISLVRPLLPFSRASIEVYCHEHGLEPRQDSSNNDTRYRRNAIRHEIVPRLRQLNPQIDVSLARLGQIVAAEQDYMQQQFMKDILPQINFDEIVSIPRASFFSWHIAMQRRALIASLAHLGGNPDFERIEAAIALITKGELGAIAEFGDNIYLRLNYEILNIHEAQAKAPDSNYLQISESISLILPSSIQIGDFELIASETPLAESLARLSIPQDAQIRLRTRRDGDRFQPLGMARHSRKLKKWLIDHKIPQYLRDKLPLLEVNGTIAAILLPDAWAISEAFAVQQDSPRVLYFEVKKL